MNDHHEDTSYFLQCLDYITNMDDVLPAIDYSRLNGNRETISELVRTHQMSGRHAATEQWRNILKARPEYAAMVNQQIQPARYQFSFVRPDQLTSNVQWLVQWNDENILPAAGLALLIGKPGSGKSFLAQDLAHTIGQQHSAIYLASEGQDGFKARVGAWCNHYKRDAGNVFFQDPNLETADFSLLESESIHAFIEAARTINPRLIVIDTLIWAFMNGDENSATDMQRAIAHCRLIQRSLGATVLLVHHTPKSGDGARGSSALLGGVDVAMRLNDDDGVITLSCEKAKYAKKFTSRRFGLVDVKLDNETCPVILPLQKIATEKSQLSERQRFVLSKLDMSIFSDSGARVAELIDATELARSSLYSTLNALKKHDPQYVEQDGSKFKITSEGQIALTQAENLSNGGNTWTSNGQLNWTIGA